MISLVNFSIRFKEKIILENINSDFPSGKLTALIGRNGCGKSTLIRSICGLNKKYEGEIFIEGLNIRNAPGYQLAKIIAYVNTRRPQMANLRCEDIVALGRSPHTAWHGGLGGEHKEIVKKAIELVGMQDYTLRYFHTLSDGESQKIIIARAIAQDTPIIILDEPTSFLDMPTRFEIINLMKTLCLNGKTIIYSTHELDLALKFSDYIALIQDHMLINLPSLEMKDSPHLSQLFH